MEIAFNTRALRTICEDNAKAERDLGYETADSLKRTLADLRAAETIGDLIVSPPQLLENPKELAVSLADEGRLIFRSNHVKTPVLRSGAIDWSAVTRVKVMGVRKDDH